MKKDRDYLILGPQTETGQACVRHLPDHSLRVGVLRAVKDGENVAGHGGELVMIKPAEDGTYDVESFHNSSEEGSDETQAHGPAQVATDEYRMGWDRIFGAKSTVGAA